jgi:hypothetical protein
VQAGRAFGRVGGGRFTEAMFEDETLLGDVELCRVFEREGPDGSVYLVGMLGDAGIAIVKDPTRQGAWRVTLSDPNRVNNRDDQSTARAIAAPTVDDGWSYGDNTDMNDEVPSDVTLPPSHGESR